MPQSKFQRMIFALITVIITVHAYVFYSLYVINGSMFMNITGETGVVKAINVMGGISVLGKNLPIWAVVLIEFVLAYGLEILVGSPLSFRLACKVFNPAEAHPIMFETVIICATVGIMCSTMSFIASILYYPYGMTDFNVFTLLANWLKLVCYNLPFAYFSQLLFIQPFVRTIFKKIFVKNNIVSEVHT